MIQKNLSATLATNQDQVLFQPIKEQVGIINNIGGQAEYAVIDGVLATLKAGGGTMYSPPKIKVYDARGNGDGKTTNAIVGGHECSISDYTSIVLVPFCRSARPKFKGDAETWIPAKVANTLNTFDQGETRANELVICLQGNGIDRADTAGCNGKGWNDAGVCYTLNTIDRPAVAYLNTNTTVGALCTADAKYCGNQYVNQGKVIIQTNKQEDELEREYIVRRLTPTECARLQGFPDTWGVPDHKDDFTDEEYHFWLEVRNTHAAINGRQTKEYTKEQMLKWYNKLHTDSAEYKMWGNGLALPTALYVMEGIAEEAEQWG